VHRFNLRFDETLAKPVARAYVRGLPRPARNGVSNFFRNLRQPVVIVNSVLQGDGTRAWQALGRFLLNSTVGVAGVFDPASHEGFPESREDFGQTLGRWGWRHSRYLELPLFGPSTLRDSLGMVVDYPLNPANQLGDGNARWALRGLRTVNTRAQLLPSDALREGAADDYTLVRDAWLQQRNYQIEKDRHPGASVLPDYLQSLPTDAPVAPSAGDDTAPPATP
jgi:phospholipid-binding lipoprotein MlaA